jgi:hypothetical protein
VWNHSGRAVHIRSQAEAEDLRHPKQSPSIGDWGIAVWREGYVVNHKRPHRNYENIGGLRNGRRTARLADAGGAG